MDHFNKWQFTARSVDLGVGTFFVTQHLLGDYKGKISYRFFPEDRSRGALYLKARTIEGGPVPYDGEVQQAMGVVDISTPKILRSTHPISAMSQLIALKPADKWVHKIKTGILKIPVRCPHDSLSWYVCLSMPKFYGFIDWNAMRETYQGCSFHKDIAAYNKSDHGRLSFRMGLKA